MCGRFVLTTPESEIAKQFQLDLAPPAEARYNIAPTQPVLTVRERPKIGGREALQMSWGLVPSWAKDPKIGNRMINARADTVEEKPAYRNALRKRRCLLPANGFYEWKDTGERRKQPYFFRMRDGSPFGFAGLWEYWKDPKTGQEIVSCVMLTTDPNDVVGPVHDRMPVILPPDRYEEWLDVQNDSDPDALRALLQPYPAEAMEGYPVGMLVNRPDAEGPELIAPLEH